jgi:hypothetical protein
VKARGSIFLSALLVACADAPDTSDATFEVPSSRRFDVVARTLDAHCGTLDCHGASSRNFRLFGFSGRRLDPTHVSGVGATTALEAGVDYCSLTAIEPEVLARVVVEGGVEPERLTFLRKARGSEEHVGETVFAEGSAGDECLVTWISGRSDDLAAPCEASLGDLRDPPPPTDGTVDLSACNSRVERSP